MISCSHQICFCTHKESWIICQGFHDKVICTVVTLGSVVFAFIVSCKIIHAPCMTAACFFWHYLSKRQSKYQRVIFLYEKLMAQFRDSELNVTETQLRK